LSWTSWEGVDDIACQNIEVTVVKDQDLFFVNAEMVEEMLLEKEDSLLGKSYRDMNIYLLEEFLDAHPNIGKAELHLTIDGVLCVDVSQRKPLVRVFEQEDSYYLDEEMMQFPLSEKYSARVLQVYWSEITDERRDLLASVMELVDQDEFLKAQITAIEFDTLNEIIVYPRVGDHKIILGEARDLTSKFEKLKIFYREGLEKTGWNRYSHINLKFKDQVVCTKR